MCKTNLDSYSALYMLSKIVGKSTKSFSVAGTKDKRGITTQRVAIYLDNQIELGNQLKYFSQSKYAQIKVSNFEMQKEGLNLGDLSGNEFRIILRSIEISDTDILASLMKRL